MAKIINLTRKEYDQDNLVSVCFSINADNINTIETSGRTESWEHSIITMNNGVTIDAAETKEEIAALING